MLKYNFVDFLVHFHILSFVSIVFVNSCNSALVGCHMIWIKAIYLSIYLSIYWKYKLIFIYFTIYFSEDYIMK